MMIKSTGIEDDDIVVSILDKHVPDRVIDADIIYAYERPTLYKSGKVKRPSLRYIVREHLLGCRSTNSRNLPLRNNTLRCVMYSPPHAIGIYESFHGLMLDYVDTLSEIYRILCPGGILIVRCQDIYHKIHRWAMHVNFVAVDLFVKITDNKHTYFWVFCKAPAGRITQIGG